MKDWNRFKSFALGCYVALVVAMLFSAREASTQPRLSNVGIRIAAAFLVPTGFALSHATLHMLWLKIRKADCVLTWRTVSVSSALCGVVGCFTSVVAPIMSIGSVMNWLQHHGVHDELFDWGVMIISMAQMSLTTIALSEIQMHIERKLPNKSVDNYGSSATNNG